MLYFFQLVLQALPSVIREGLVVDFSLSQAGFGGLSSSFYYPYILLQVPAGLLVFRFGARTLLILGIILCTLVCFLTPIRATFSGWKLPESLMGLGSAPTFVSTATLAASWFPLTMLPILIALIEALGMLGTGSARLDRSGFRLANRNACVRLVRLVAPHDDCALCEKLSRT